MQSISERMRLAVEQTEIRCDKRRSLVQVKISGGASGATPSNDSPEFKERLVEAADAAMYQAKKNGGNQTQISSLTLTRPATR